MPRPQPAVQLPQQDAPFPDAAAQCVPAAGGDTPRWVYGLLGLILLAGVALRLVEIDQPYIDKWSWRQADVGMIAANFYHHGFDFFHSRIDWAGRAPGYVGTEFPLVPYMAAVMYRFTGVQEWVGRVLSLFFFALSVPLFFALVRRMSNCPRTALLAVGIYVLLPLNIFASRCFMPDMASLTFSLAALLAMSHWVHQPRNVMLGVATMLSITLALLIKVPAMIIGLPLAGLAWECYGWKFLKRWEFWLMAVVPLGLTAAWYFHSYRVSAANPPYHFFGSEGMGLVSFAFYRAVAWITFVEGLTPVVSLMAFAGLFCLSRTNSGRWTFHLWLVAMLFFIVIAGPGNRHPWYRLPLTPVVAGLAAMAGIAGLDRLRKLPYKWSSLNLAPALTCGLLLIIGLVSYHYVQPWYRPWGEPAKHAGEFIAAMSKPDDLIVAIDCGDPTLLYYSKRQGWHFLHMFGTNPRNSEHAEADLIDLRHMGAEYLVIPNFNFWWLDQYKGLRQTLETTTKCIESNDEFKVYDLTPETPTQVSANAQRHHADENQTVIHY